MFNYKIGDPNKVEQAMSWIGLHTGRSMERVLSKLESVVTGFEVPAFSNYYDLNERWYLNLPVSQSTQDSPVVWVAPQVGQYGVYWTALMRSKFKPDTLFHLSAPDEARMMALISYLRAYLSGEVKVSAENLLIKVDKFFDGELPEGITSFFNVSFKRGKTYESDSN